MSNDTDQTIEPTSNPTSPIIQSIPIPSTSPTISTSIITTNSNSNLPKSTSISSSIHSLTNGNHIENDNDTTIVGDSTIEDSLERIKDLEEELVTTRLEKETFEAQYRSLLGKLTTMRNTLGDKLKQDAVSFQFSRSFILHFKRNYFYFRNNIFLMFTFFQNSLAIFFSI